MNMEWMQLIVSVLAGLAAAMRPLYSIATSA